MFTLSFITFETKQNVQFIHQTNTENCISLVIYDIISRWTEEKKTLCVFTSQYCPIRLELDRLRKCFPVLWVKWIRWSVSGWRDGVCLFNIYILCQRFSHRWCALIHPSPLNTVRHSRLSECLWIFEFIWLQKECAEIFSLRWCLKTQILSPALVLDQ